MSDPALRRALRGIPASGGIAVGTAVCWGQDRPTIVRRSVDSSEIAAELARFRRAIEASRRELEQVRDSVFSDHESDYRVILDAHLLMHGDALLVGAASKVIATQQINAEWALRRTIDRLKDQLRAADSDYFRARAEDVEHVGVHILRHLVGEVDPLREPPEEPTVLVAEDLTPADAARLLSLGFHGIVIQRGSPTSHTAILARALEVPTVVGVRGIASEVERGDPIIVDGLHGDVVVRPARDELERAEARRARYLAFRRRLREGREACATRDGVAIELHANVDRPEETEAAVAEGASGIGLFRTEFLFLHRDVLPTEDEQLDAYRAAVHAAGGRPVVFRTFDLGGDKLPGWSSQDTSTNPALGLRATRLFLHRPDLAKAQLRAVLRCGSEGHVRLMFPLVSSIEELRAARSLVEACADELAHEGLPHARVPIGMMVEIPASAILAAAFAKEADFFAVGTNDLVQYTLAADRGNPDVAHLACSLDPAVLTLLRTVAAAAANAHRPLSLCGDMAADALALPLLVGLGYRTLSVPSGSLAFVRESIRRIDAGRTERLAMEALSATSAADVRRSVADHFHDVLGDLWEEQGIEI